jgi:hypothetical protein
MDAAVSMMDDAERRRRRMKNIFVALALFAFFVLIYLITIVKLRGNVS